MRRDPARVWFSSFSAQPTGARSNSDETKTTVMSGYDLAAARLLHRCVGPPEHVNNRLAGRLALRGNKHQTAVPHRLQHDGVAEHPQSTHGSTRLGERCWTQPTRSHAYGFRL